MSTYHTFVICFHLWFCIYIINVICIFDVLSLLMLILHLFIWLFMQCVWECVIYMVLLLYLAKYINGFDITTWFIWKDTICQVPMKFWINLLPTGWIFNDDILTLFIFTFSGNSFQEKVIWFSFLPFCVFNYSTNTYHTFLICFHFWFISVMYMCVCMCGIYIVIDFYLTMYTQLGRWFHIKDYVQNFFVTWCIVSVSWQVESVMMIYWHNFFSLFFRKLSFQVKVIKVFISFLLCI